MRVRSRLQILGSVHRFRENRHPLAECALRFVFQGPLPFRHDASFSMIVESYGGLGRERAISADQ